MKKLLVFDLDGTLINTLEDLKSSVNFALSKFNYPLRDLEYVRKAIGNGVALLMERCGPKDCKNSNELLAVFKEHYNKNYNVNSKPYDGMLETLIKLKNNGYLLAVVTNKINDAANKLVTQYYPNVFECIQGEVDYLRKKPYPDMLESVLKKLNIEKEDVCYVGDTNVDYDFAKNSGVDVILVTYGFRTKEEMNQYNIHCDKVSSTKEIAEYFISD